MEDNKEIEKNSDNGNGTDNSEEKADFENGTDNSEEKADFENGTDDSEEKADFENGTDDSEEKADVVMKADKQEKKGNRRGSKVLAAAGIVLLVGNIGVTAAALNFAKKAMDNSQDAKADTKLFAEEVQDSNRELRTLLEDSMGLGETKEDDVRIAGEYTIKSTTQISDAYISGDSSKLSDKDKETLKLASDVLDEIIEDGMTSYEKEKAVYDWMTKTLAQDKNALLVIPTAGNEVDNPHGVLKGGNAVCVGYATTFRLFMQMLRIECKVVHNTEAFHSWNLVKLDEDWYHVDIYSDAGNGNYANFNLSDNMMTQSWDMEYFPAANGMKYNYFYDSMITVDDVYGIPSAVRKAIDNKEGGLFIKFKAEPTKSDMYTASEIVNAIGVCMMNNPNNNFDNTGIVEDGIDNSDAAGDTKKDEDIGEIKGIEPDEIDDIKDIVPEEADDIKGIEPDDIGSDTDALEMPEDNIPMPMGISNNTWIVDPTDNKYVFFVSFEMYSDDANNKIDDIKNDDIDRDRINEELQNAFGDVYQDINIDIQMDGEDYYE